MTLLALLACGGGAPPERVRPPNVATAAAHVHYSGNALLLDDRELGPSRALLDDPTRSHAPLKEALSGRSDREAGVWIGLPTNATWSEARAVLLTAGEAGAMPAWIGPPGDAPATGPLTNSTSTRTLVSCDPEGVPVVGMGHRLTFETQMHAGTRWVSATLRFLPRVAGEDGGEPVLAELLPESCWRGAACAQLADATAREACEAASGAPVSRLPLGGPAGCIAPVAKGEAQWRAALPASLTALGIEPTTPTMVMADEPVPLGDVLQLLGGLADHGITDPQIGLLNMGSGEPEPTCDLPVRTAADVAKAAGTWYGAMIARTRTPEETP
ncbi:MAG: hypothetical protein KC656_05420 [Myxococcales bacterium]|nr:hypothetical protein [Myxococcales bacterium]MCB9693159.1 hypothetical protein [Alphaproteobacteria bacterium]